MLRIWREALGGGRVEWRGKVQHVLTGEARHFRSWPMLACQLEGILSDLEHSSEQTVDTVTPPQGVRPGRPGGLKETSPGGRRKRK
jgi:hypothetical protein